MSQFKYTLPSGAKFTLESPAGTTQDQADYTFYSQVAAGALVGLVPGQSISGTTSSLAKFSLSRLDRGTAGVDDTVILSIINGIPSTGSIPSLVDIPLQSPVTQADVATTTGSGFTAPAIGALTSGQTQALMAQVANLVGQPATAMTNDKGVGQYGLKCQQLEMAGYVKPGIYQQFIQNGSGTLVDVLAAPGIWTGLGGINSSTDFLNNTTAQNTAQATLMTNGYNSLQAAGVIKTPGAQSVSALVGTVYTGTNPALTTATTTITNEVNSQVAALVTNSSQFGTQLAAQWASGLPPATSLASNLTGIVGQLGTVNLASSLTAMNVLGKASQFASTAASSLSKGLGNLSNLSITGLGDKLSNISVGGLADKLGGSATALAGQLQGQATSLLKNAAGQLQGQANALLGQAQGQLNSLLGQADSLVSSVQTAAGFANTVNRATVDVAFTKILGSSKIPLPSFGAPNSASIGAALDIGKAQSVLQGLQAQGSALAAQAQGQANNLLAGARNSVNQLG